MYLEVSNDQNLILFLRLQYWCSDMAIKETSILTCSNIFLIKLLVLKVHTSTLFELKRVQRLRQGWVDRKTYLFTLFSRWYNSIHGHHKIHASNQRLPLKEEEETCIKVTYIALFIIYYVIYYFVNNKVTNWIDPICMACCFFFLKRKQLLTATYSTFKNSKPVYISLYTDTTKSLWTVIQSQKNYQTNIVHL